MYHKRSAIRIPMTVILMVISKTCRVVTAIDCYVCTSDEDNCGTNVNEEQLILEQKVASACKSCVKEFKSIGTVWSTVTRSCGQDPSNTCRDILGYGRCTCTTTFCNHGYHHAPSLTLMVVLTSLSVMFSMTRSSTFA
ncbi:uncharacterized protein LOC127854887 [Dreissena polymorpha]|uniref:Protein quiver n=1 Tax=Dreissena polymorpha TaxID=45954 RepID=A0A9D4C6D9_DREPO|nr:uncharacterized protein LOC127854887 [Dreissena polymorpha]KAH3718316.1 hypothetical protein DPMN_061119 [Dreissena polymorpha]